MSNSPSKSHFSESDARHVYEQHLAEGKTVKQAVTATAEALGVPRRRLNDLRKRRNWRTEPEVETEAAFVRRLAKEAQVSEDMIRKTMLVSELEAAGESPRGTKQAILEGKTTQRKVLFAYRKKKGLLPPKENLRSVSIKLTEAEATAIQEIKTPGDDPFSGVVRKLQKALTEN